MNSRPIVGGFNIFMLVLSIFILVLLLIDTAVKMNPEVSKLISIIDNGICVIFFFEFLYRFKKAPSKLQYMKLGWLDLLASIPNISALRFARFVRVVRIIRAIKATKFMIEFVFKSKNESLKTSVSVIAFLLLLIFTG